MIKSICRRILGFIKNLIIRRRNRKVRDKNLSIISNNCIGANISGKLGLRYNSPTVNLQILPSQYVRFIENLRYYLKKEMVELNEPNDTQEMMIKELYGVESSELKFPLGIIDDDIVVCFQHYTSFMDAKSDWDRRKKRVDNCAYVFIADVDKFEEQIMDFYHLNIKNKLLFLWNSNSQFPDYTKNLVSTSCTQVVEVVCPRDVHFMEEYLFFKSYYEKNLIR